MKTKIQKITLAISLVIIAVFLFLHFTEGKEKDKEIARLKRELAHANTFVPLERDTVILHKTDTVEVATSPVIMAELRTLRRQHAIDEQFIKDLQLQLKQVDAVQSTSIKTADSVKAQDIHNQKVFSYDDRWSHLQFSLQDSTFYYNIRDSLSTVVYHEFKHRFLWWRWGVKGYKVKITNHNPHSSVSYNRYIKVER